MLSHLSVEEILNEDFFHLIGLSALTEEEKEEMLITMNQTVQARVYLATYQSLSLDEQKELDLLSAEQMYAYLEKKGYDLLTMIMDEALKYRIELVTAMQIVTTPPVAVAK